MMTKELLVVKIKISLHWKFQEKKIKKKYCTYSYYQQII